MAFKRAIGICDHGWSKGYALKEDAIIMKHPFYGAIDTFSEPHSYRQPPMLFDGKTGGEMIAEKATQLFKEISDDLSLEYSISIINTLVGKAIERQGLPQDNAGCIPGACLSIAKIREKALNLLQFGDCLIFWRYFSGEIGYTSNPIFSHEKKAMEIRKEILARNGNNKQEMWVEFAPILSKLRQQDINNPRSKDDYYILNGQPILEDYWNSLSLPIDDLELVMLCSDGYFHWEETAPGKLSRLAERMLNDYRDGLTLAEILIRKRMDEEEADEATAVVLEFK